MSMEPEAVANMRRYYGWTYKVYLLTFPDGKIYVGQTELDVTKRWRGGLGYKDNREMFDAILWQCGGQCHSLCLVHLGEGLQGASRDTVVQLAVFKAFCAVLYIQTSNYTHLAVRVS